MPTYEYACTQCGQHVEVFQRFSEPPLQTCGVCGGSLRKVFHPAGIVFKGSGFYATDNRSTSTSKTSDRPSEPSVRDTKSSKSSEGSSSGSSDTSSSTSSSSKTPTKEKSA